jgi:hypothetical protein
MIFKKELENLAKSIAKRAGEPATPFAETVEALKALSSLYAIFLKDKGAQVPERSDGFTMADAQATIEDYNGETAVRGHRGQPQS